MAPAETEPLLWEEIQQFAPDVLVLEQEGVTPLSNAVDALPRARLVSLSLSQDRIRVYECHDIERRGLEGVVDAIMAVSEQESHGP